MRPYPSVHVLLHPLIVPISLFVWGGETEGPLHARQHSDDNHAHLPDIDLLRIDQWQAAICSRLVCYVRRYNFGREAVRSATQIDSAVLICMTQYKNFKFGFLISRLIFLPPLSE